MKIDVWKAGSRLAVVAAVAQMVLVLVSWLWSAAMPDSQVRSLLSPRGIRWFFGRFVDGELSPALVWLLLMGVAVGGMRSSGVLGVARRMVRPQGRTLSPLQRFAIRTSVALLLIEMAVVALLTLPPHALLLSVTGDLFPSSFSVAAVPIVAFLCTTVSVCYGLLAGVYHTLSDVGRGLCSESAPLMLLVLIYVLVSQVVHSVTYVFVVGNV